MKKARLDRRNKEKATPKKDKKYETWTGEKKQSALIASRQSVGGTRDMGQDLFTGTNPEDYRTFDETWTGNRDSWELQKLKKL